MVQVAARQVVVLDPTGEVLQEVRHLALRLDSLRGKVVGILDNSNPVTGCLLEVIGETLVKEHGAARVIYLRKPNHSYPCPPDLFQVLVRSADCLIAGAGV